MRIVLAAISALLLTVSAFGKVQTPPKQGPPPKNLTKQTDGHISANAVPANPDAFETHVVQPGETLSQIANGVLKDYMLWPQLWEMNEHIVNPHWIYPNDKILIRPITKITDATPPPAPVAAPKEEEPPARPVVPASTGIAVLKNLIGNTSTTAKAQDVFDLPALRQFPGIKNSDMYCAGFVRSTPVPATLKISSTYERNGAALSTDSQYVHINSGSKGGVTSGTVYQVIRPTKRVSDPSRDGAAGSLGMHYLDVGQIQVVQVSADSSLARVVGNCDAIDVGDMIIPFVHYDLPELPRNRSFSAMMTPTGQTKGSVVFMKNIVASTGSTYKSAASGPDKGLVVGEGGIVYLNLGKGDGLKVGDLFIVYHDNSAIGEVAVLRVEDKASSALVTYSTAAFVLGDRVERR